MSQDHDSPADEPRQNPQDASQVDPPPSGKAAHHNAHSETGSKRRPSIDRDAQEQVISSLRAQVQDLFSQVTQLNNKLVKSYDRVSDLEDDLHIASSNVRASSIKISQLELERTHHLSALNTGLLVEKDQVTAELTRLMEKATDEAARRGEAETARETIEKELDDLSAGLFDQANRMVAEARFGRAQSERKADDAERALRETEEVVRLMQLQMQELQAQKEASEATAAKGKWVNRTLSPSSASVLRLLSSHLPYQEFLAFVAHLRNIRPSSSQPPAMSTLLPLPFLTRLITEDTDPTVRLDLAPSLNWLTRRSVLSAIHHGQLSIEPISTQLLIESTSSAYPSLPGSNPGSISCALCGTSIYAPPDGQPSPTRSSYSVVRQTSNGWFKNPLSSAPPSPPPTRTVFSDPASLGLPPQLYIFRLSAASSATLPVGIAQGQQGRVQPTIYPLCTSGWCLSRMRTTCSLWAFVRTSVVEKVWEEEAPSFPPPPIRRDISGSVERPPIPPRKRGLWGFASALGMDRVPDEKTKTSVSKTPEPEKKRFVAPIPSKLLVKTASAPPPLPQRSRSRAQGSPVSKPTESSSTPTDGEKSGSVACSDGIPSPTTDTNTGTQEQKVSTAPTPSPQGEPEAFLTPVEEVPSTDLQTMTRSGSPSTIPLPESLPNTPDAAPVALPDEQPAAPVNPPSEGVAQPAAPVAPPLPRRAAARARPVPPPPSQPAEPTSTEPTSKPEELVATSEALAATETVVEEKVSDVPAKAEGEETSLGSDHKEPMADEAKPAVPPRPSVDKPRSTSITSSGSIPNAPNGVNGVHGLHAEPETVSVSEPESEPEQPLMAPDGMPFVGETTWEERTWKELVNLREEMFWARVGGAR
ncbi:hypothetical protein OF83DRAFT_1130675 [Amylostereum chailletii]|nr:hypothetical protein OF83DRAFT_1130675 [Amylostereum chailletii]